MANDGIFALYGILRQNQKQNYTKQLVFHELFCDGCVSGGNSFGCTSHHIMRQRLSDFLILLHARQAAIARHGRRKREYFLYGKWLQLATVVNFSIRVTARMLELWAAVKSNACSAKCQTI